MVYEIKTVGKKRNDQPNISLQCNPFCSESADFNVIPVVLKQV